MMTDRERALLELLDSILECNDLTGWCGEDASPLYDQAWEEVMPMRIDRKVRAGDQAMAMRALRAAEGVK